MPSKVPCSVAEPVVKIVKVECLSAELKSFKDPGLWQTEPFHVSLQTNIYDQNPGSFSLSFLKISCKPISFMRTFRPM